MQGKAKDIAKEFFLTFTTQEKVSAKLYPHRKRQVKGTKKLTSKSKSKCCKAEMEGRKLPNGARQYVCSKCNRKYPEIIKEHYVEPIVNITCRVWGKYGFLKKSNPIYFKDSWGRTQKTTWNIMSLEPIFKFCREKGIEFSEKDKEFLNDLLLPDDVRQEILNEYPEDDIIHAALKYYANNCILRYFYLLRDVRENPDKYKGERAKAEELNNPQDSLGKSMKEAHDKITAEINKKFGFEPSKEKIEFDVIKTFVHSLPITSLICFFIRYLDNLEGRREMILSIDEKVLRALNMRPQDLSRWDNAPAEPYTILTNQRGVFLYASLHKLLLNKSSLEIA